MTFGFNRNSSLISQIKSGDDDDDDIQPPSIIIRDGEIDDSNVLSGTKKSNNLFDVNDFILLVVALDVDADEEDVDGS